MSNSTARRNESPAATTSDPEVVAFRAQFVERSSLGTAGGVARVLAGVDARMLVFARGTTGRARSISQFGALFFHGSQGFSMDVALRGQKAGP